MKSRYLVLVHNPLFEKCPSCSKDSHLHRSVGKKLSEHLLTSFTLHRLYRCGSCGWRGYLFKLMFSTKAVNEIFICSTVAAAACLILTLILKRIGS